MFNKPNLPPYLEVPYSFINELNKNNNIDIAKTSLNYIRNAFKGFETFDDKNIVVYYFKRFNAKDDLIVKSFKLILDWSEIATKRYVKIVNLEQVTLEMNDYFHENFEFDYNKVGRDIEKILCSYQIQIFLKKTLAEYILEISNIPVYEDQDDLAQIGMNKAMEIDVDKIYIDAYDIVSFTNSDNW